MRFDTFIKLSVFNSSPLLVTEINSCKTKPGGVGYLLITILGRFGARERQTIYGAPKRHSL